MGSALSLSKEVKAVFKEHDRYILLAGLGGYTGTYMVDLLIPWLQGQRKEFAVLCSLPFDFEGEKRRAYAREVLEKYQALPNCKSFDFESVKKKYGNKTIKEAIEEFYLLFKEIYPQA